MSKNEFGKTSLVYLGYIIQGGELKIDPSKVEAILYWLVIAQLVGWAKPDPTTKKVLQLGNPTPNAISM
jgi:hypothetical protein